jgi:hypothetical protein
MKLALHTGDFGWAGGPEAIASTLVDFAVAAEEGGSRRCR